jgi:N-acetylglucosaminyldiphosphoundecaprenol N-acetyl-beta-D-mannosaminyltransferase
MHVMHRQVGILGAYVDCVTLAQAVQRVREFIQSGLPHQVVTVNVDFVRQAQNDNEFLGVINRSALAIADGMPLVWASSWMGDKLPERVTGVELVDQCCRIASEDNYRVFLLGGEAGVAQSAAQVLTERHPGLQVVGAYSPPVGPFSDEEDSKMVNMIREAHPDILLVAFGAPKQDLWIAKHQHQLAVPLALGVGGVFNFLTGRVKRAPGWMQERGLEWLYRVIQEPGRLWRRYFVQDMPVVMRLLFAAFQLRVLGMFMSPMSTLQPQPDLLPEPTQSHLPAPSHLSGTMIPLTPLTIRPIQSSATSVATIQAESQVEAIA